MSAAGRRTVVITGASDGIGAAAARTRVAAGDRVLIVGRSPGKTAAVAAETGAEAFVADFARFEDVRRVASEIAARVESIDVLANNAGGVFGDREPTVDGHERTFQVNHLSPFLLTELLHEQLVAGGASVVNTSSVAAVRFGAIDTTDLENSRGFTATRAYGDSKLANILHVRGLHHRYGGRGISAVAFHPGMVGTSFAAGSKSWFRLVYRTPLRRLFLISAAQGGTTLDHFIAGRPGVDWQSGAYYDERTLVAQPHPQVRDDELVEELWRRSAAMVGLPG
ncbi:short-chain dehydrogenase [Serinibacter arcticus]|uniref:Short-chain dehydrogenase n=1 Tax=Serinibacter arcticus TaxID=1655435 RepID=A0A2U1ZX42_9MICO|nr:SDR family NAD(P)-dependent oxidoreductase [Serinibacter arcticus]PWD51555.1 short-chain dehydrogenase [Serinibacter arcticus]